MALATLKTRAEFLRVRGGRRCSTPAFLLEARPRSEAGGAGPRFGFTVSKKIGGAVVRNRVRRRLRALAAALPPALARPGYDYVLVARQGAVERAWPDLKADLDEALRRVHQPAPRPRESRRPR